MLRATCDLRDDHFEAKAFRDVERSLDILLVRTVTELASVVITPREELSVTSLFFIFVVYIELEKPTFQFILFQITTKGLSYLYCVDKRSNAA